MCCEITFPLLFLLCMLILEFTTSKVLSLSWEMQGFHGKSLIMEFIMCCYDLIGVIVFQANIWFKCEHSIWAIHYKENACWWRFWQSAGVYIAILFWSLPFWFTPYSYWLQSSTRQRWSARADEVNVFFCFQPTSVSPEHFPVEDQASLDSTTTLLHARDTRDTSRMEGMS